VSYASTALLIGLVALVVALVVVPKAFNGQALTVLSGSMRPVMDPGDIAVVAGVEDPSSVKIGDVIAYMPYPNDPTLVTHRVVGIGVSTEGGTTFTTQGDANTKAMA
jgi:signal peptidase